MIIAIFLLTFYIPFEAVIAPFIPTIVQKVFLIHFNSFFKGFKKTTIALLVTLMLPFSMIVTFAIVIFKNFSIHREGSLRNMFTISRYSFTVILPQLYL
jgi:hypothetical protein